MTTKFNPGDVVEHHDSTGFVDAIYTRENDFGRWRCEYNYPPGTDRLVEDAMLYSWDATMEMRLNALGSQFTLIPAKIKITDWREFQAGDLFYGKLVYTNRNATMVISGEPLEDGTGSSFPHDDLYVKGFGTLPYVKYTSDHPTATSRYWTDSYVLRDRPEPEPTTWEILESLPVHSVIHANTESTTWSKRRGGAWESGRTSVHLSEDTAKVHSWTVDFDPSGERTGAKLA